MQTTDNGQIYRIDFDNWGEFLGHVARPIPRHCSTRDSETQPYSFNKTSSYRDALDLAQNGWPEGIAQIKELSAQIFDLISHKIIRYDPYHDVEGAMIDIARYIDGEPECWIAFEENKTQAPASSDLITLVFNASASAGVRTEVMERKGAAITALTECLEFAGKRVKVVFVGCTSRHSKSGEFFVTIKEFDQPLDMDRLAFALIHPSMFRRLTLRCIELMPEAYQCIANTSYGSPADVVTDADIYIQKAHLNEYQWSSESAAITWIRENLKSQGIELKEGSQN